MEASTWANVLAGVALVGTVVGFLFNRAAAKGAGDEARRATAAAERAAAAQERLAQAAEEDAARHAQAAPEPEVAWRLAHHNGDTYLLENVGTATAYNVLVTVPERVIFRPPPEDPVDKMGPRDSTTFMAVLTMGASDDRVTVSWEASPGAVPRETWSRPLPPKPPRAKR